MRDMEAASLRRKLVGAGLGTLIRFGNYPQTITGVTMPIYWRVRAVGSHGALLLCRLGLESRPFHSEGGEVSWDTCSLRAWLNGEFFEQAFCEWERGCVARKRLDNQGTMGAVSCGSTWDRVFLLSNLECDNVLPDGDERVCVASCYAQGQGANCPCDNDGAWWLRSGGLTEECAACVDAQGNVVSENVAAEGNLVRPALWIGL